MLLSGKLHLSDCSFREIVVMTNPGLCSHNFIAHHDKRLFFAKNIADILHVLVLLYPLAGLLSYVITGGADVWHRPFYVNRQKNMPIHVKKPRKLLEF